MNRWVSSICIGKAFLIRCYNQEGTNCPSMLNSHMMCHLTYIVLVNSISIYSIQFLKVQIEVSTHPRVAKLIESGGSRSYENTTRGRLGNFLGR